MIPKKLQSFSPASLPPFGPVRGRRPSGLILAVLATLALWSASPQASAGLVMIVTDSTAAADGTGWFEVLLQNGADSTETYTVGGFSVELAPADSSVTFTGIDDGTPTPYIFAGVDTFGFLGAIGVGGASATANDLTVTGGVTLAAGQSYGLARIAYRVAPGSVGPVVVSLVGAGTSLADADALPITDFGTVSGTITVGPQVVPEPSAMVLLGVGTGSCLLAGLGMRKRA